MLYQSFLKSRTYDRKRNSRGAGARVAFHVTMVESGIRWSAVGDLQVDEARALLELVPIVLSYTLILAFLSPSNGCADRVVRLDGESDDLTGACAN